MSTRSETSWAHAISKRDFFQESKINLRTILSCALLSAAFIPLSPLAVSAMSSSTNIIANGTNAGQGKLPPLATADSKQKANLLFLGNKNIAPVVFLEGAVPAGIAVDIVRELAKHIPQQIEIRAMDWTEAQALVANGEADALIQINQNDERKKIYDFSGPLLESHFSIFTTSNRVDITSITSLRNLRVGVEASGLPHQILSSDPKISLIIVPNFLEAFTLLKSGSIDAVVVDYRVGAFTLAINNIQGVKVVGTPIASSFSTFAVKKGNTQLLNQINYALEAIKEDGTYQRILDKWKPAEVVFLTQQTITDYFHEAFILFLIITILATGTWLILLQRELKRRKRAESAEQKAQRFSDKLIEAANAMIIGLDTEGNVTVFNEMAEKISGYRKDEVIGKNWFALVVPRERFPETWKIFKEFKKQGKSITSEFQNSIITKSGEERLIAWRNSDLRDGDAVIGTISYGLDVTDQNRIEKERRESAEKFSAAFNASPDLMAITRISDGLILEINDGYTRMLGYSRGESVGKTTAELGIWANAADRATFVARLKEDGQVLDFETTLRGKDGSLITVIDSARTFDLQGEPCVLSTAHDISERKHSEVELQRMNRALSILSETNQALIHIKDEKALLNKISQIIIETGGYKLMRISFADQDDEKSIHTAVQAGFGNESIKLNEGTWGENGLGPASAAMRTGKTQVARDLGTDPDITPWRKVAVENGCTSSISLPLLDGQRPFGAVTIYTTEIDAFNTKEIAILEELTSDLAFGITTLRLQEKIKERTKEINEMNNKFIHIVSHQLNTPLNIIRWSLETIMDRKRGEVSPAQMELLKGTYAADVEIISRLSDLLSAINIEEGQIRLTREAVNMNDLMGPVCEEKLQLGHLKNISYEIIAPPAPLPIIQADAEKIRDVVTRLIDNALTYTKDGGHIVVKFFEREHRIHFEITDNGIGIPRLEQPRIFERFHRGWNATQMKPDASGLSLYLAKKYIDIHGGTIGFATSEEHGSTFWFELPIEE